MSLGYCQQKILHGAFIGVFYAQVNLAELSKIKIMKVFIIKFMRQWDFY